MRMKNAILAGYFGQKYGLDDESKDTIWPQGG